MIVRKGQSYLFLFHLTYTPEVHSIEDLPYSTMYSDDDYVVCNLHKLVGALNAFYNLPFMVNDACRGILK